MQCCIPALSPCIFMSQSSQSILYLDTPVFRVSPHPLNYRPRSRRCRLSLYTVIYLTPIKVPPHCLHATLSRALRVWSPRRGLCLHVVFDTNGTGLVYSYSGSTPTAFFESLSNRRPLNEQANPPFRVLKPGCRKDQLPTWRMGDAITAISCNGTVEPTLTPLSPTLAGTALLSVLDVLRTVRSLPLYPSEATVKVVAKPVVFRLN